MFKAQGDVQELIIYSLRAIKFVGFTMALPVGLISGLARPLLEAWLGRDYVELTPLVTLLTLPLALNLAYMPLHQIALAANKVRLPALVQLAAGAINLILSIILVVFTELGVYGVALAGLLVLSVRNLLFTPLYAAHLIGVPYYTFYRAAVACAIATLTAFALSFAIDVTIGVQGWLEIALVAAGVTIVYSLLCYIVLLSHDERSELVFQTRQTLRLSQ